jgi:hypothetical protein
VIQPAATTSRRGWPVVLLVGAALSVAWGNGLPRPDVHALAGGVDIKISLVLVVVIVIIVLLIVH